MSEVTRKIEPRHDVICNFMVYGRKCNCGLDALRSRAEAAEAEASNWQTMFNNMLTVEATLQAEVARLKEKVFPQKAWHCDYCGQVVEGGCYHDCKEQVIVPHLRTRIAELEAGLREIHETATWALEESPAAKREGRGINPKWVADLCAALLGEGKP